MTPLKKGRSPMVGGETWATNARFGGAVPGCPHSEAGSGALSLSTLPFPSYFRGVNHAMWQASNREHHITTDLSQVDWKSRTYRAMEYGHAMLTPTMQRSLRVLLLSRGKRPQARTIGALRWRGLVDSDGQLTGHGQALALMRVSLEQQCRFLNLPLEEWCADSLDSPEETVLRMLAERGIRARFVGNTFCLFIDCLMGDALVAVAERLGKQVFTLNLPYDPELLSWVKRDLDEYLDRLDRNHFQKSLAICAPILRTIIMDETPMRLFELFDEMYRALGVDKTRSLLRMYLKPFHN